MTFTDKVKLGATSVVATVMTMAGTCFADDAINTAMGTALGTVESDAKSGLATVAPYAIGIMGVFLVWRYGVKFFKSISK